MLCSSRSTRILSQRIASKPSLPELCRGVVDRHDRSSKEQAQVASNARHQVDLVEDDGLLGHLSSGLGGEDSNK